MSTSVAVVVNPTSSEYAPANARTVDDVLGTIAFAFDATMFWIDPHSKLYALVSDPASHPPKNRTSSSQTGGRPLPSWSLITTFLMLVLPLGLSVATGTRSRLKPFAYVATTITLGLDSWMAASWV